MIIIKVRNLKTNSRLRRQLCEKYQFHSTHWSESLYKADSRNVCFAKSAKKKKSAKKCSGFHILILFLKTLKLSKLL